MALVVALAGGGTGGHVYPALAIAQAIGQCEPDTTVRFVGSPRGLETRVIPAAGYPLDLVPSRPVLGRGPLGKLAGLASIARGVLAARRLLREESVDLVIGVGGYVSVPTVLAARWLGLPIGLVEADAVPGQANRLLGRFARAIFVQFEGARRFFPHGRTRLLGFPVRTMPGRDPSSDKDSDLPERGLSLLVVGGSQGAQSINRAICGALEQLRDFRITHQTGSAHLHAVRDAYRAAGVEADVAPFYEDLPQRLAAADLVVARAGASTIAELCTAGVAAVLVPYPHAAHDHQMANARELERAGGCRVVADADVYAKLSEIVRALADDPSARAAMGAAARRRAEPDAARRIWEVCRGLVAEEKG